MSFADAEEFPVLRVPQSNGVIDFGEWIGPDRENIAVI
jgi:hypothetical protein